MGEEEEEGRSLRWGKRRAGTAAEERGGEEEAEREVDRGKTAKCD